VFFPSASSFVGGERGNCPEVWGWFLLEEEEEGVLVDGFRFVVALVPSISEEISNPAPRLVVHAGT
jgi:hypothetical protein